jgi:hypothetical protein
MLPPKQALTIRNSGAGNFSITKSPHLTDIPTDSMTHFKRAAL